ncbi:MAG: DUF327 family protein [Leptospiraceae bacterium]|nr:DUF327 family protein [Leptospiraceae bacterium]
MHSDTKAMRIFGTGTEGIKTASEKKNKTEKKEAVTNVGSGNSFLELLESIAPSDKAETKEINTLWQKLPDIEKKFLASPNAENMNSYKNLVKEIVNEILKSNTTLSQARQRGKNDKRILMSVKVIDENIQILALTMINPNNSAFNLLKQIEKIRGLLLDMQQ